MRSLRNKMPLTHPVSSFSPSYLEVMPVMMTNTSTVEEKMAEMEQRVTLLTKALEDKDVQIATLMNKLEVQDSGESNPDLEHPPGFTLKEENARGDKGKGGEGTSQQGHSTSMASISVQQLQDMIRNTIRAQYGGSSTHSLMYSKPYTERIDNMRMPNGYQPPKFLQFDGKGNPKQHIAHFVETCENAGTQGGLFVKQFVRSLKGNAFDWYTDLEPESIDSWDQLEREFLNRFYSTCRTVSMMELTNTKQWKDEPVVDYISRWRSLSLDCKDRLSEISAVEMCIQGMHWGLLISCHENMKPPVPEEKKERREIRKNDRNTKSNVRHSMNVNSAPVKISTGNVEANEKRPEGGQRRETRRSLLKEWEQKVYPFLDADIPEMLEQLLSLKLIELPECKQPEEIGKVDDPNYCKYHRIISHPIQKCFERKIDLDVNDVAQSNLVTFAYESPSCKSPTTKQRANTTFIRFGSLEPVQVQLPQKASDYNSNNDKKSTMDEEEGWTLVTRKRWKKRRPQSRRKNDKRKKRLRTEMCDDLAQTQKFQSLVTLEEFFPIKFFQSKSAEAVHTIFHCEVDEKQKGVDHGSSNETLSSLEQLKSQVDKVEPSQSSTSPKEGIIQALEEPKIYTPCTNTLQQTQECFACSPDLTFTDEDLLLGPKPHNRPLYVSGYVREQKIDRILIDGGSAINILPKMTMRRLGLAMEELSHSRLVIQGFNQGGQHAIGMIHLELIIGELTSNVLFHVIDAKTTYNMLLGRPWIHGNGIVSSTLHQYFKYLQSEIKKVDADLKPFSETEAHFADVKFYAEDDIPNEVLPVEVPSMKSKQGEKKHVKFITRKDIPSPKEDPRYGNNQSSESTSNSERAGESSMPSNKPPFLRYVPLSRRKNGQSPFTECLQSTMDMQRPPTKLTMKDVAILKENHVMPLTSSTNPLPSKPLNGFVRSSQSLTEHGILPSKQMKEWFDPKAYRLLAKTGYDFSKQSGLGKLIPEATGEKMHDLSKTQGKMQLEGHEIPIPKIGIGYTPEPPAQIWINKRSNASRVRSEVTIKTSVCWAATFSVDGTYILNMEFIVS
ncbi:hypothetical protein ACB092_11G069900 [Castanea dentata]